jgi:hypothetical protein
MNIIRVCLPSVAQGNNDKRKPPFGIGYMPLHSAGSLMFLQRPNFIAGSLKTGSQIRVIKFIRVRS